MTVLHRIELVDLLKENNMLGPAAEVGVAEGNFSRDLLAAGIPHLYMVDNWATIKNVKGDGNFPQHWHDSNYKKAKKLVEGYSVTILKGLSLERVNAVPDNHLSLVYLDADHSYTGVLNDLIAWYAKVTPGGIIAGHDYCNPAYGVYDAVIRFTERLKIKPITIPETMPENASFYFIKP